MPLLISASLLFVLRCCLYDRRTHTRENAINYDRAHINYYNSHMAFQTLIGETTRTLFYRENFATSRNNNRTES